MTATWEELDGLILQYVADHEDEGQVSGESAQAALAADDRAFANAVDRLIAAEVVEGVVAKSFAAPSGGDYLNLRTTGGGRERLGLWPSPETLGRAFLAELERIADDESADPVERNRARELASKVAHWGAEALVGTAIGALPGVVFG